jgi:peptide/nickel transport system permease protein
VSRGPAGTDRAGEGSGSARASAEPTSARRVTVDEPGETRAAGAGSAVERSVGTRLSGFRPRAGSRLAGFRPRAVEVVCVVVLVLLLVAAVAPWLLAPADPLAIDPTQAFRAPSFAHPLGTDESGRDTLTRIVHGAGPSLLIGVCATGIGVLLALVLGAASGLGPRWLDFGSTRLVEVMFAFPGVLLALLFLALTGPGTWTTTIAVGLAVAPGYARILRGEFRRVRDAGYVEQSLLLGYGWWHRLVRHILPNAIAGVFVVATLGLGQTIVWAAALSYLGLGTPPPAAEWGAMLSAGRTYLLTAPWLTLAPGAAIVLAAASTTLLGRAIEQRRRES